MPKREELPEQELLKLLRVGAEAIIAEIGNDGWRLQPTKGLADRYVFLGQALRLALDAQLDTGHLLVVNDEEREVIERLRSRRVGE